VLLVTFHASALIKRWTNWGRICGVVSVHDSFAFHVRRMVCQLGMLLIVDETVEGGGWLNGTWDSDGVPGFAGCQSG